MYHIAEKFVSSPPGLQTTIRQRDRDSARPAKVSTFTLESRSRSAGISGDIPLEWAVVFTRNTQKSHRVLMEQVRQIAA
jgi:hypothetical protein